MNFTSEEDFEYVTGDLSGIVIGNDIMPLREPEHQLDLRGMDIAFLMEAAEARRLARQLSDCEDCATTFTNQLQLQQVQDLSTKIDVVGQSGDLSVVSAVWYEGQAIEISGNIFVGYPDWLHQWPDENRLSVISISSEGTIDSNLCAQSIQAMFDSVVAMKQIMRKRYNAWAALPETSSYWVHVHTGSENYERTATMYRTEWINEKVLYGRIIAGGGEQQAYWTLDAPLTPYPNCVPEYPECKNANGQYAGREVYAVFWASEAAHLPNSQILQSGKYHVKKVSDENGDVTENSLRAAFESVRTSGQSPYDFDPPTSTIYGDNDYYCYIYFNQFFIFDTVGDRTRWDVEEAEEGE